MSLLTVSDLNVTYANGVHAVRDVSFTIESGQCLALVGESGCGKTTIARSILHLLPADAQVSGQIQLSGEAISAASPERLRALSGYQIGYVAQDPFQACNPLDTIETHVDEAWQVHRDQPPPGIIPSLLHNLGIENAQARMKRYPHQWSGGMLQRATIAAAAAHRPVLIIADEPTSALDADRADSTLTAIKTTGCAILLVSHDIGVVSRHADRIAVCYAGEIVEIGDTATILSTPCHPYTIGLLAALPHQAGQLPQPLEGTPPRLIGNLTGCAFALRCRYALPSCRVEHPVLHGGVACPVIAPEGHSERPTIIVENAAVLPTIANLTDVGIVAEVRDIRKTYGTNHRLVTAIQQANLSVNCGEIVGISGPSGCGKSTLLRILATMEAPDSGNVCYSGELVVSGEHKHPRPDLARRGYVMPIFQDPLSSLDRRWALWRLITEPLTAPHRTNRPSTTERREIARHWLAEVGLAHLDLEAHPFELSIGQCQRISIARALAAKPALIVADEPTSALDASVSASILHLLAKVAQMGTALVIVSHDRAVLAALCHRVLTMHNGILES